jgi:hypothetical protein
MRLLSRLSRRLTDAIDVVAWRVERLYGRVTGAGPQVKRRQYYPRSRAGAVLHGAAYCAGIAAVLGVLGWASYQGSPHDGTSNGEGSATAATPETSVANNSKDAAKAVPVKAKKAKAPRHAKRAHKAKRHARRAHKAKRSHKRSQAAPTTTPVSQPTPSPSPAPVSSPPPAPVHASPAPSSGGGGGGGGRTHSSPPPRHAQQPAAVPFDSSG